MIVSHITKTIAYGARPIWSRTTARATRETPTITLPCMKLKARDTYCMAVNTRALRVAHAYGIKPALSCRRPCSSKWFLQERSLKVPTSSTHVRSLSGFNIQHKATYFRASSTNCSLISPKSPSARFTAAFRPGHRYFSGIGTEPGLDPRTDSSSSQQDPESEIKIIDFSKQRLAEQDIPGHSLLKVLNEQPKPGWAACRWIFVNGLNRDVVRQLGVSRDDETSVLRDTVTRSRTRDTC